MYHHSQMRRGFSIVLMLVFGLALLSPLVEGSEDANLPVCCRRHGAHQCAMAAMRAYLRSESTPAFNIPVTCPDFPGLAAMFAGSAPALVVTEQKATAAMERGQTVAMPNEIAVSNPARKHTERGPPAISLL